MSEPRYLARAPIREAVIDIQVTPPASLDALKAIDARLKDLENKPHKREELWHASIGVSVDKDGQGSTKTDRNPIGFRYTFYNKPYGLQNQVRGFTFSHLPPYGKWEEMSSFAKELWEIYLDVAKPQFISRIAVRYINSLPIPLPITDFADYLNVPPIIPEGLPQELASFLQRFVMVENETGTVAVVTQVLEQITQTGSVDILFDVDVSKAYSAGVPPDTDSIWTVLEELRNFKNRVFFKFLTEKTIGIFE